MKESKEVLVPEVMEDDEKSLVKAAREQARVPAKIKKEIKDIDPHFMERLGTRGDLSEYIERKVKEGIKSTEELISSLKGALKAGLISEKMFEAGAKLIEAQSKLLEQMNKVKAQEEKFSVESERVWVEKVRMVYGKSDVPEAPPGTNVLVITREALLDRIEERAKEKEKR